jgi:hypothetical protein
MGLHRPDGIGTCSAAALLCAALVLTSGPPSALAAPVTWSFAGRVTRIQDDGKLAASGFSPSIGDPIQGSLTFDPEHCAGDPIVNFCTSYGAPYGLRFSISGTDFTSEPGGYLQFIQFNVFDNFVSEATGTTSDGLDIFTMPADVLGLDAVQAWIIGFTEDLSLFSSAEPPLVPPDFSRFEKQNEVGVSFNNPSGPLLFVAGSIESMAVPEPPAMLLIGLAVLGLARRHRIPVR